MRFSLILSFLITCGVHLQAQVSLEITTNASWQMFGEPAMAVSGDWENNGTFVADSSSVVFDGPVDQTITNPNGETFFGLVINNAGGAVILDSPVLVEGTLALENGVVDNSMNGVTLGDSATVVVGGGDLIEPPQTVEPLRVVLSGNEPIETGNTLPDTVATVVVTNSSTVTLSRTLTIIDSLALSGGTVSTGQDTLVLGAGSEGTLVHTTGIIEGNFARFLEASSGERLFPVGIDTSYRPLAIDYTTAPGTPGIITVAHTDPGGDFANVQPPLEDGIERYAINRRSKMFWTMSGDNISGGAYSLAITANGQPGILDPANIRIIHSDDGQTFDLVGAHTPGKRVTAKRDGISGDIFNRYYIGGNSADNPLEGQEFPAPTLTGWNMLGLPRDPEDRHYRSIFPTATEGSFFTFLGDYVAADSFEICRGYWIFFDEAANGSIDGTPITGCALLLAKGWNMISGISEDVALTDIFDFQNIITPGTLFGFNGDYVPADTLKQGQGYWINANATGLLIIIGRSNSLSTILNGNVPILVSNSSLAKGLAESSTPPENYVNSSEFFSTVSRQEIEEMREAKRAQALAVKAARQIIQSDRLPALKISDARESSRTLRFNAKQDPRLAEEKIYKTSSGNGNERSYYLLPPPPPTQINGFDARFSGGYHTSEEDEAIIELRSNFYPLRVEAVNLPEIFIETEGEAYYTITEITGTAKGNVYRLREGVAITIEDPQVNRLKLGKSGPVVPREFMVSQNFPNPFNPATTIRYGIPQEAQVSIIIYNALGQKIKTLLDKKQAAGYYRLVWDSVNDAGNPAASGIYFYRVSASEHAAVKKMLLLK